MKQNVRLWLWWVLLNYANNQLTLELNLTYGSLQLWNLALVTSHTALCRTCTACVYSVDLALFSVQSSLIPRPTPFLPSVCIHSNTRKTGWNEAMCRADEYTSHLWLVTDYMQKVNLMLMSWETSEEFVHMFLHSLVKPICLYFHRKEMST